MKKEVLFGMLIVCVGVIARAIDGWEVDVLRPGIGQLVWLVFPLLLALFFQFYGKETLDWGFVPNFKQSWRWYLFALLFFPVLSVLLLSLGSQGGWIFFSDEISRDRILLFILLAIPIAFIKNMLEEFVWRGYLYSSLEARGINRLHSHLLIGVIWSLWHLPYLDAFSSLYHDLSWGVYVPLFLVGLILTSIIYGEVRRQSGTVWTAVLLHTMANACVNTLFIKNYIQLKKGTEWFISPAVDNIGYIFLVGLLAWVLYKWGTSTAESAIPNEDGLIDTK